jgi:hypothetical protein
MSHIPKKYKGISKDEYAARKKILNKYVRFSFKARTRFNRGQKSAITKAWNKYINLIGDIEKGVAKYKDVKKKSLRKSLSQDYPSSNKGVFVYDRDPNLKLRVSKSGLEFIRTDLTEFFVPFPRRPGLNFAKWALSLIDQYRFDYVALRVGLNHGRQMYDPITSERYFQRDVYNITKEYSSRGEPQPFTGLFFIDACGEVAARKAYNEKLKSNISRKKKRKRYSGKTKTNKRNRF